jgi:hypothetical protein
MVFLVSSIALNSISLEVASYPIGAGGSFSGGVKWPEREADHSIYLVPRIIMRGAIPPFPQYVFMAWSFAKHRDNCTFYLLPNLKFIP